VSRSCAVAAALSLALLATPRIRFAVEGPGELVAIDHGDPTSCTPLQAHEREAFSSFNG
jgi:glycosyl hydrolase family 2